MTILKKQKNPQKEWSEKASFAWNNEWDLVFTNELGEHLYGYSVSSHFEVDSISLQKHCILNILLQIQQNIHQEDKMETSSFMGLSQNDMLLPSRTLKYKTYLGVMLIMKSSFLSFFRYPS